jgi:hypothetical protein
MLTAIIAFLSLTIAVVWSIVFLPASILGIRVFKINGVIMKKFLKKVVHSSIWTNDEPDGWICGKGFIGFVHVVSGERNESKDLWLVCSKAFYEKNVQLKMEGQDENNKKITYWVREGCFWRLNYNSRQIPVPKFCVTDRQQIAINKITEIYERKGNAVVLLYGKPGGGKSMTAQYLCSEFLKTKKGVSLCKTHKPYEHGDNFESFYNRINPTEDCPLVLVFEEVDGLIWNLHCGKIEQRHHIPVQIKNKTDWDTFLDDFNENQMFYPHIILMMTTNKSPAFFDDLDPAYFRGNRLDATIEY